MKSEVTFAGVLLVAMVVAAPAGATQGRGQAKKAEKAEAHQKADGVHHGEDDYGVFDRDGHVRVIRDYQREGLPPGLAKRQSLPPGLAKQLRERGELRPASRSDGSARRATWSRACHRCRRTTTATLPATTWSSSTRARTPSRT